MSKAFELIEKFPVRVHLFKNFITEVKRAQNNISGDKYLPSESSDRINI